MSPLVRRYIKTAMGFLIAGLALGGWMLAERELWSRVPSEYVVSAHAHLLLVGFVLMMILGVALWMFPRPRPEVVAYRSVFAEIAYWLVTGGTIVRGAGECVRASGTQSAWLRIAVLTAGLAQIAGVVLFFAAMWDRVRAAGSGARSAP